MINFVSVAHAAGEAQGGDALMGNLVFMGLLFAVFYFLLIRPQQKQAKEHKEMVNNLARGDNVVVGGILGKIHKVEDDIVVLEVGEVEAAPKNFKPVRMKVRKGSVTAVTVKSAAPAAADDAKK